MEISIAEAYLWSKNFLKYPEVTKEATSINQEKEIESKVDHMIWDLYEKSEKKLGRLGVYNQLKESIRNTDQDRIEALAHLKYCERWFLAGLEIHSKIQINPTVTKDISKKLEAIYSNYTPIITEGFFGEHYFYNSLALIKIQEIVKNNIKLFDQIPYTQINDRAIKLKEAVLNLDYIQIFHLRSKDLLKLVLKSGINSKVNNGEFIRDLEVTKEYNESKRGPKVNDQLFFDIQKIFDEYLSIDNPEKEFFYSKKGDLVINRVLEKALNEEWFAKRWSNAYPPYEKGYEARTLQPYFSDLYSLYEKLKS